MTGHSWETFSGESFAGETFSGETLCLKTKGSPPNPLPEKTDFSPISDKANIETEQNFRRLLEIDFCYSMFLLLMILLHHTKIKGQKLTTLLS